jgi:hypothetical protein
VSNGKFLQQFIVKDKKQNPSHKSWKQLFGDLKLLCGTYIMYVPIFTV